MPTTQSKQSTWSPRGGRRAGAALSVGIVLALGVVPAAAQMNAPPGGAAGAPAAPRTDGLIDGAATNAILDVVNRYGTATLGKDGAGDPQIVGEIDEVRFSLDFYGCTNNTDCRDVIFLAAFTSTNADAVRVNEWNRDKRFGAAYVDDSGDVWLQMPVNLYGGVSDTNWDDTVDWWRIVAVDFRDFIYQK